MKTISRPKFESVPLETGLSWTADPAYRFEEKMDGVWHVAEVGSPGFSRQTTLAGELMRDGRFFAFDCLVIDGQDIASRPLRERLVALENVVARADLSTLNSNISQLLRPSTGAGGEFLRSVLARGGEGVVCKHLDMPFGAAWLKCKRVETFDCVVVEKCVARSTLRLGEIDQDSRGHSPSHDMGWCPCRAQFNRVQVGDIVEVAAYGMTAAGKLREPRFIRVRLDKMAEIQRKDQPARRAATL